MFLPDNKKLGQWTKDLVDECREDVGARIAVAQALRNWRYTGTDVGSPAIYNRLNPHLDRLASYLFSPADLRFHVEFENSYPESTLQMAQTAGRYLSSQFDHQDLDQRFAQGVDVSLTYGAAFMKLMWGNKGLTGKLVMPWNFAVYRPDITNLHEQEAMVETTYMTLPALWRRIGHLPNAEKLYKRAETHATKGDTEDGMDNFLHAVVLAGTNPVVNTSGGTVNEPGGTASTGGSMNFGIPSSANNRLLVKVHEIAVIDDTRGDYTTIQLVEPDIIIYPRMKRGNLFVDGQVPYTLIQPNHMEGYLFGRPEIADLVMLQALLRDRLEDIKKMMGLQYDKLLAFIGFSGMNDEMYDQFKQNGYIAQETGTGKVEDLTPKLPEKAFEELKEIIAFMNDVSGFQNIMSGQGESGVRAGNHAAMLLKTASPRLRDRAILVEKQCGEVGDKALDLCAAKDAKMHTTEDGTEFVLSQLPEDFRVTVDSHSSSPIYEDDHKELATFLMKAGIIDGASFLDMMPSIPMRELLKSKYKVMEAKKAQMIKEHPELLMKGKGRK